MKKYKKAALTAVTAIFVSFGATAIACGSEENQGGTVVPGPETGVYYFESAGEEYTVNLMAGGGALMEVRGDSKLGKYTVENDTVTLDFGGDEVIVGTLKGNELSLDYDGTKTFYKKVYYNVSFDSNEGSSVSTVEVLNGKTLTRPADPTRENYAFIGWYSDEGFKTPFMFGATGITENTTLYAQWVELNADAQEYTVALDLGDGAKDKANVKTRGGRLFDIETPVKDGYAFAGWYVSMYEDENKPTLKWDSSYVFTESTTLYAQWRQNGDTSKAPAVSVNARRISWEAVEGVANYNVEITGPENFAPVYRSNVGGTFLDDVDFTENGDYVIKVTANVSGGDETANTSVRYYRHNALSRVSVFSVAEPSALIFNPVENAERYYIDIKCGNPDHKHNPYDNGKSTYYNFANCVMKEDGIEFTVTAVADGWASSTSRVFAYERKLSEVGGIKYDDATQTLAWNAVDKASGYEVVVTDSAGKSTPLSSAINNVSLKTLPSGSFSVAVKPVTVGYNSPEATVANVVKNTLSAPADVRLVGSILQWTGDENAASYIVNIGEKRYPVSGSTQFDLASVMAEIANDTGKYRISVTAVAQNAANNSVPSDVVEANFDTLAGSIKYYAGIVSWRNVIGAVEYRVRVNDGEEIAVKNGDNFAAVKFDRKGINTISVRFFDGKVNSNWESIEVVAYSVEFDSRGGTDIAPQYLAPGDKIDVTRLPVWIGHDFTGWYDAIGGSSGNAVKLTEGDTLFGASDRKYFADWENARYKLTYDYGDGIAPAGSTGEYTVQIGNNYKLEIPEPNDKSKIFVGWYSAPNGGDKFTDENGDSRNEWSLASGVSVYAHYETAFKFSWLSNTESYSVVKDSGLTRLMVKNLKIPAEYNDGIHGTAPVTVIDAYAFRSCNTLTRIEIPDTVETIEIDSGAFDSCSALKDIDIYHVDGVVDPKYGSHGGALVYNNEATGERELRFVPVAKTGVFRIADVVTDITEKAFNRTKVTSIIVPSSVRNVRKDAFYYCADLNDVVFSPASSVAKVDSLIIDDGAFSRCAKLNSVTFPARLDNFNATMFSYCAAISKVNMEVAETAKYIAQNDLLISKESRTLVFFPAAKEECEIPRGIVTNIGAYAFYKASKLTEITIPFWITSIENSAFAECSALTKVKIEGGTGSNLAIGERAFGSCVSLSQVEYVNNPNITSIGAYAFYHCVSLRSFAVPNSVTELSDYAFADCSNIGTVTLGNKLEAIGNYAFSSCTNLNSITLPKTLKAIGNNAFEACKALRNVVFDTQGADLTIGDAAFRDCTGLTSLDIAACVKALGDGVFGGCENLARVTVDVNNTSFVAYDDVVYRLGGESGTDYVGIVFYPLTKSGEVTLPETMTAISGSVFQDNTSITKVIVGKNVTTIGDFAFMGCTNLRAVEFATDGTKDLTIGDAAFYGCTSLSEINLPERLTVISDSMFAKCSSLTSITIPSTVIAIEREAFVNLNMLTSVTIDKRTELVGNENKQVCDLDSIGYQAFKGCTAITSFTIPYSVSNIQAFAFMGCSGISELVFEDGDKELDVYNNGGAYSDGVFYGLTSLEKVDLPNRLVRISNGMFAGCTKLSTIELPENIRNTSKTSVQTEVLDVNYKGEILGYKKITQNYGGNGIGAYAFFGCSSLKTVTAAKNSTCEGTLTADTQSFRNCNILESLELPSRYGKADSTAEDSYASFFPGEYFVFPQSAAFKSIIIEDRNEELISLDGVVYTADKKLLVYCPIGKTGTVTIPVETEVIGAQAFRWGIIESVKFEEDEDNYSGDKTNLKPLTIGDMAFDQAASFDNIKLPARLIKIGANAFSQNSRAPSIERIEFADDCQLASIGNSAFAYTLLTDIKLPKTLTEIGTTIFSGVTGLNSITLPKECSKYLTTLGCAVPNTVKSYSDTGAEIEYPKYVTIVGGVLKEYSMANDAEEYTVPKEVTEIAASAFVGNKSLKRIIFPVDSQITTIGNNAFDGCTALTSVTFPDDCKLTTIPDYMFNGCSSLASVKVPAMVTSIGKYAFKGCSSLTKIEFAQQTVTADNGEVSSVYNITSIDRGAFNSCSSLVNISFPASLVRMGQFNEDGTPSSYGDMFTECTSLRTVTFEKGGKDDPELIIATGSSYYPFAKCGSLTTVDLGNRVKSLPNYMFYNTSSGASALTTVNGIDNITSIGNFVFYYRKSLKTFTVPDSVTSIGSNAFYGCSGLTAVKGMKNVETLGERAFYNCTSLTSVDKLENATEFGKESFYSSKITSITIAASVTKIGNSAFKNSRLESVIFENSADAGVCEILDAGSSSSPFYGLGSYLKSVDFGGRKVKIGKYAFASLSNLKTLSNTQNITAIGENAFYNGKFSSFEMPTGITTIEKSAFEGCTNLTSVTIPANITEIKNKAFAGSGVQTLNIDNGDTPLVIADASSYKNGPFYKLSNPPLTTVHFNGRPVEIGNSAFDRCSKLVTVDGLEGVTKIGVSAFQSCGITSFDIPESVTTLGNSAFKSSKLVSVSIPTDSFAKIWDGTFMSCTSLKEVTFTGSGTMLSELGGSEAIGGCFQGCTALTNIELPSYIDVLGDRVFYGCGFVELTVPMSVTSYGMQVYAYNRSLESVTLPTDSVESFGYGAFAGCDRLEKVEFTGSNLAFAEISDIMFMNCVSLSDITLPTSVSYIGSQAFQNTGVSFALHEGITFIGNMAFDRCSSLTEVIIPASVTELMGNPFTGCDNLTDLSVAEGNAIYAIVNKVIYSGGGSMLVGCLAEASGDISVANTVTTIQSSAFMNARITGVIIEGDVTVIDSYTFYNCTNLRSVALPSSVKSIGAFAFNGCSSLESIIIPEGVISIGEKAFTGCEGLLSVRLPSTLISMGKNVFDGCKKLNNVVVPAELAVLPDYTFANCKALTSLTFAQGSKLSKIGTHVFEDSGLTTIEIPAGVLYINNNEFYHATQLNSLGFAQSSQPLRIGNGGSTQFVGCDNFSTVDFNGRATYIDGSAFDGCTTLSSVSWEDIREIGLMAFRGCTSLTTVTVPSAVKKINSYAFQNSGVDNLTIENGVTSIEPHAFDNIKITAVDIPGSVRTISLLAFANCARLKTVTMHSGTTDLGTDTSGTNGVFENCTVLDSVTLPDTLKILGTNTFAGCSSLKTIDLPISITAIGIGAFANTGLTSIDLSNLEISFIKSETFANCTALTDVTLPERLTAINGKAFLGCTSLKSIVLPVGVNAMSNANLEENTGAFSDWDSTQTIYVVGYASEEDAVSKGARFADGWSGNANVVWGRGPETGGDSGETGGEVTA